MAQQQFGVNKEALNIQKDPLAVYKELLGVQREILNETKNVGAVLLELRHGFDKRFEVLEAVLTNLGKSKKKKPANIPTWEVVKKKLSDNFKQQKFFTDYVDGVAGFIDSFSAEEFDDGLRKDEKTSQIIKNFLGTERSNWAKGLKEEFSAVFCVNLDIVKPLMSKKTLGSKVLLEGELKTDWDGQMDSVILQVRTEQKKSNSDVQCPLLEENPSASKLVDMVIHYFGKKLGLTTHSDKAFAKCILIPLLEGKGMRPAEGSYNKYLKDLGVSMIDNSDPRTESNQDVQSPTQQPAQTNRVLIEESSSANMDAVVQDSIPRFEKKDTSKMKPIAKSTNTSTAAKKGARAKKDAELPSNIEKAKEPKQAIRNKPPSKKVAYVNTPESSESDDYLTDARKAPKRKNKKDKEQLGKRDEEHENDDHGEKKPKRVRTNTRDTNFFYADDKEAKHRKKNDDVQEEHEETSDKSNDEEAREDVIVGRGSTSTASVTSSTQQISHKDLKNATASIPKRQKIVN